MTGDPDAATYPAVAKIVRATVSNLGLYLPNGLQSRIFTVPDSMVVPLTNDVLSVVKVGVISSDGKLMILWEDNTLRVAMKNEEAIVPEGCETDTVVQDTFCGLVIQSDYGEAYGYYPERYPWGAWRYDQKNNTIELSSGLRVGPGDRVVVEYRTSPGAEAMANIPIDAEMSIIYKALSMLYAGTKPGLSQYNLTLFRREWGQLKRLHRERHPEEWAATLQQYIKGGVKG